MNSCNLVQTCQESKYSGGGGRSQATFKAITHKHTHPIATTIKQEIPKKELLPRERQTARRLVWLQHFNNWPWKGTMTLRGMQHWWRQSSAIQEQHNDYCFPLKYIFCKCQVCTVFCLAKENENKKDSSKATSVKVSFDLAAFLAPTLVAFCGGLGHKFVSSNSERSLQFQSLSRQEVGNWGAFQLEEHTPPVIEMSLFLVSFGHNGLLIR